MSSQFFGLNIGAGALSAFQTSVNTTANNIANVQTTGYTRQTTNLESTAALRVNAKYGSTGTGVAAVSITQERNLYYDTKYWQNNSSAGLYEQKLYYLSQIETIFTDDGIQQGFSTIFSKMFNSLDTLKTNAGDESVRNQFIHNAQSLCTYFNALATNLSEIQKDCNEEIKSTVDNINAIAQKIALLNKEVNRIEVNGGKANELRDERANLIDELSSIVNVEVIENEVINSNGANLGGTNYTVVIIGQVLVEGNDYQKLMCVSEEHANNLCDPDGLYTIYWQNSDGTKGNTFAATTGTSGGTLKGLFAIRDGNNNEGLTGTVPATGGFNANQADILAGIDPTDTEKIDYITNKGINSSITITNPSITDINAINIPSEGRITVNNRTFEYESWEAVVGDDGITSYTFYMKDELSLEVQRGLVTEPTLTVGVNVDAMGVPYYQAQINEFFRNFAEMFNDIEKQGETLSGEPMDAFFKATYPTGNSFGFDEAFQKDANGNYTITSSSDSYYLLTAFTAAVNEKSLKDPTHFATTVDDINGVDAYDIVEKLQKLQSGVTMFRGNDAQSFLETLLSDISVDTEKTETYYKNYNNLRTTIGNQRMSISGVDEDEEALNLIKFQNAYNMASKLISTLSEMYDKLINETGVT